jgi:hypothetical protein
MNLLAAFQEKYPEAFKSMTPEQKARLLHIELKWTPETGPGKPLG